MHNTLLFLVLLFNPHSESFIFDSSLSPRYRKPTGLQAALSNNKYHTQYRIGEIETACHEASHAVVAEQYDTGYAVQYAEIIYNQTSENDKTCNTYGQVKFTFKGIDATERNHGFFDQEIPYKNEIEAIHWLKIFYAGGIAESLTKQLFVKRKNHTIRCQSKTLDQKITDIFTHSSTKKDTVKIRNIAADIACKRLMLTNQPNIKALYNNQEFIAEYQKILRTSYKKTEYLVYELQPHIQVLAQALLDQPYNNSTQSKRLYGDDIRTIINKH